jgi:hypothetical protein
MGQVLVNIVIGVVTGLLFYRLDQQSDVSRMVPAPPGPGHRVDSGEFLHLSVTECILSHDQTIWEQCRISV